MRSIVAVLVLGVCAGRTVAHLDSWRDDEALWRGAVAVSPEAPRPALNLAVALERRGAVDDATAWAVRAARLADQRSPEIRKRAGALLTWIDVTHAPLCDRPSVSRWCAP